MIILCSCWVITMPQWNMPKLNWMNCCDPLHYSQFTDTYLVDFPFDSI